MLEILNNWLVLIIIAVFIMSVCRILQKYLLTNLGVSSISFSMMYQLFVGIFSLILAYTHIPNLAAIGGEEWFMIIAVCIMYFIANALFFMGLKNIEASETALLTALQVIWYLVLGRIFFGESVTYLKIIGSVFIFIGLYIVYYNKNLFSKVNRYYLIMVAATIFFAFAGTLDKYIMANYTINPSLYQVFGFVLPALLTFIFIPKKHINIKPFFKINKYTLVFYLSALIYIFVPLSINTAYKLDADASIVGPLMQTSTVVIVLMGILFLNEKDNLWKKIIGSVVVLIGAVILKSNPEYLIGLFIK